MLGIIKSVICILMSFIVQVSVGNSVQMSPEDTAEEFLQGLSQGNDTVVLRYIDNDYINLIENAGNDKVTAQFYESLFRNFSYEITDSKSRNNVAVVKMSIVTDDFSKVLKQYEKDSYKYITSNLYDKDIGNKKKLSKKCLEIYLDDVSKAADGKDNCKGTIYIPMVKNEHNGWDVLVDDKLMSSIFGGLVLPKSQ